MQSLVLLSALYRSRQNFALSHRTINSHVSKIQLEVLTLSLSYYNHYIGSLLLLLLLLLCEFILLTLFINYYFKVSSFLLHSLNSFTIFYPVFLFVLLHASHIFKIYLYWPVLILSFKQWHQISNWVLPWCTLVWRNKILRI